MAELHVCQNCENPITEVGGIWQARSGSWICRRMADRVPGRMFVVHMPVIPSLADRVQIEAWLDA